MATLQTQATRPSGNSHADGKAYFETSTNKMLVWNATAGAWIELDSDGTGAVPFENRWGASFDGSNDTLSVSDSSLDLKTDFSISCWFNRGSGVASWDALVSWGEASNGKYRAFGFNANNNLTFNAYARGYDTSGQTLSNSTWYHGVLTLSGTGSNAVAKVYVNGSLDSTVNFALVDYSTYAGQLFGASTYGGVERFEGAMGDVAIFDSVLDQTAITALYGGGTPTDLSSLNPVGYWRMGDHSNDSATSGGSIATITDSSGNGNDATQSDVTKQPTFKALDQSTTSLDFSSDYLDCGGDADFSFTDGNGNDSAFSISAWVKLDSNIQARVAGKGNMEWLFGTDSSGRFNMILWSNSGTSAYIQKFSTALPTGSWQHIVCTYDGSNTAAGINLYKAGSLASSTVGNAGTYAGMASEQGALRLGQWEFNNSVMDGLMDEVAIFNTELSASDVSSLAASRGAHIVNDLSLSPVAYYRMGEDDNLTDGQTGISQITDASGHSHHATQSDTTSQPTASVEPIIYV